MRIIFGTDGVRGPSDQFPFTQDALYAMGRAVACWAVEKYGTANPSLLIGSDTRASSARIVQQLSAGLIDGGIKVFDGGVLPTPAVCLVVNRDVTFSCGIVVSASHNPWTDNGIKLIDRTTCKLGRDDELAVQDLFEYFSTNSCPPVAYAGSYELFEPAADKYVGLVTEYFKNNCLTGLSVVLDCAYGATYQLAPHIFRQLGATVHVINDAPDGVNINQDCGAVHPEALCLAVREHNADLGFAFDGDGDRVIAVSRQGEVKDGDHILSFLVTSEEFAQALAPEIVGTIMTNQGFQLFLHEHKKQLVRTAVGDKFVAQELEALQATLGGEPSGHIIIRDYLSTGDGIFVALKVAHALAHGNNKTFTTFQTLPQVMINVRVAQKDDLSKPVYENIILNYKNQIGHDTARVVVRYSGTENVLRVMVESDTHEKSQAAAQGLAQDLAIMLSNKGNV